MVEAMKERYLASSSSDKHQILDELVALTGYHRKHAIRALRSARSGALPKTGAPRSRIYDDAVSETLAVLWEASNRICGKRLKVLLPILMSALERHGHVSLDESMRRRLLAVSAATIDRLLAGRRETSRLFPHELRSRLSRSSSVRTPTGWSQPAPGFLEMELVAHGGGAAGADFAHTLVLTDLASGWIEHIALLACEEAYVVGALDWLEATAPFTLRGIANHNGCEPIREIVLAYCDAHKIELTRSRPHPVGDEPRNGAVARHLVGRGRLAGPHAVEALARLYMALRLFVNFFQPSFRLAEKSRVGDRVSKRYHAPETPCARLLASPSIDDGVKEELRAIRETLDPLRLLDEIRAVQQHLAALAQA